MTERKYSSTAGASALTTSASDTVTSIGLVTTAGLPSQYPYTLVLDPGTVSEEIVSVVNASGTVLTVTRGEDGTSAQAHSAGAIVRHMATARDFREPQQHIEASVAHGRSSALVGVSDPQTIQNKTFDTSNVFPATAKAKLPADTVYTGDTQTLTGKTISGASNTLTNIPKSALPGDIYYGATTALPATALSYSGSAKLTHTSGMVSWVSGDVVTDAQGAWASGSPTRLTAKSTGAYLAIASQGKTGAGTAMDDFRVLSVSKNGTVVGGVTGGSQPAGGTVAAIPLMISVPLLLTTGDYVEMAADEGSATGGTYFYSFTLLKLA